MLSTWYGTSMIYFFCRRASLLGFFILEAGCVTDNEHVDAVRVLLLLFFFFISIVEQLAI